MGPWGEFEAETTAGFVSSYATHSSIMWVLLNVGLISYLLILFAYVSFWLKARKRAWNDIALRAFGEGGFAGFVFCIPSFILSPLISDYRAMALIGFCLALPYVAYYYDTKKPLASVNETII